MTRITNTGQLIANTMFTAGAQAVSGVLAPKGMTQEVKPIRTGVREPVWTLNTVNHLMTITDGIRNGTTHLLPAKPVTREVTTIPESIHRLVPAIQR